MMGTPWDGIEPADLRALLTHAPIRVMVLAGDALRVEVADPALLAALFPGASPGEAARAQLAAALGDDWLARLDRVRETGVPEGGPVKGEAGLWDLWVAALGDGRVALYAGELGAPGRGRALLHALRNPIYGIRAAVKILLRRDLDAPTRDVLTEIERAAGHAEQCVKELDRPR